MAAPEPKREDSRPQRAAEVVQTRDLTRLYQMKGETVRALDGVTLSLDAGEFTAIAGPSGSGKSTLLNLIGGLDRPTSGSVTVAGTDLATLDRKQLALLRRDEIGFIFQAYNLVPVLTALENVEYVMLLQGVAKDQRRAQARRVLSQVGLGELTDRRPNELSGGQQQRVAIARAIAARPKLVLADEPTANLDSTTGEGLLDLMSDLNQELGMTFLFSTHDRMVMERARRLITLKDGHIDDDETR